MHVVLQLTAQGSAFRSVSLRLGARDLGLGHEKFTLVAVYRLQDLRSFGGSSAWVYGLRVFVLGFRCSIARGIVKTTRPGPKPKLENLIRACIITKTVPYGLGFRDPKP